MSSGRMWILRPPHAGEDPGGTSRPVVSVGPPVAEWTAVVPAPVETDGDRAAYVIEVCSTCGTPAVFPFCEHRPDGPEPDGQLRWCEPLLVRPTSKHGRELARRWIDKHRPKPLNEINPKGEGGS